MTRYNQDAPELEDFEYDALTRKEKRQEREGKTDGGSDLS